jgi:hypothetical protein
MRDLSILKRTRVFMFSCEYPLGAKVLYRMMLRNESNDNLTVLFSEQYPDTLIPNRYEMLNGLPAQKDGYYYEQSEKYKKVFAKKLPKDTLSIFIFNGFVTADDWQQIRNNYDVVKRYDISLGDLERLNFTLVYPPNSAMSGIKMYPK